MTREQAVRKRLRQYGLRVTCLACGAGGRWFAESQTVIVKTFDGGEAAGRISTNHLRDVPCPRCLAIALRSNHWIGQHPELAADARRRALATASALGRR